MRWRILLYLAVIMADSIVFGSGTLALSIACVAYLVLVYPVIFRERR